MRQGSLILAAGRVRSKKNEEIEKKKEKKKIRPTQNTPRNPQQPGDRDHLETAIDETRPTRLPILARFHRFRVCGNRLRTALAISKNDECYTYTDRQTDKLNNGTLYTPRYEEAFLPIGKNGLITMTPKATPHTCRSRRRACCE